VQFVLARAKALQAVEEKAPKDLLPQLRRAIAAAVDRAANSRGPGGPTGPLGTTSRTPWMLSR
jgi:hypothetical protein